MPIADLAAEKVSATDSNVLVRVVESGMNTTAVDAICSGRVEAAISPGPLSQADYSGCRARGIELEAFPIAKDAVVVAVNRENSWAYNLSKQALSRLWTGDSDTVRWSDLDPDWPDAAITTFARASQAMLLQEKVASYIGVSSLHVRHGPPGEAKEDPMQGLGAAKHSVGLFTYSRAVHNRDRLRVLKIDGVEPSEETISKGSYKGLEIPIYLYVNSGALEKAPELKVVPRFLTGPGQQILPKLGFVQSTSGSGRVRRQSGFEGPQ